MPRLFRLLACLLAGACYVDAASTPPKPLNVVAPVYPALTVKEPIAGEAVLVFTVGEDGGVQDPVVESADDPAFAEAALTVMPEWTFEPATVDGKPVEKRVSIPFQFNPGATDLLNRALGRLVYVSFDETPVPLRELGQRPRPTRRPGVMYPKAKEGSGEEQRVPIRFVIGKDGATYNPEIMGEVDKVWVMPALATVAAMRFEPFKQKGEPVLVELRYPLLITEKPPERRAGGRGPGGGGRGAGGGAGAGGGGALD